MKASLPLAMLIMVSTAAPALATSFDCVAPELPLRSTTEADVHRVQKKIKIWRSCYAGQHAAGQVTPDAQKLNVEVHADIQKWIDATRAVSPNPINASLLAYIERERNDYLDLRHKR